MGTAQCGGEPLPGMEKRFAHAYCLYAFCEKSWDSTAMLLRAARSPVLTLTATSTSAPAATRSSSSSCSSIGCANVSIFSMLVSFRCKWRDIAATLSLVAGCQSGCTVTQNVFCAAPLGATPARKAAAELSAANILVDATLWIDAFL